MVTIHTEKLTLEDFIHLYETEGPFEIIDGERIALMPPVQGHSEIAHRLWELLFLFLIGANLGKVYHETVFVLPDANLKNWVKGSRVPDVMFIRSERLSAYKAENEAWAGQPLMLVPDLVVEVVSENDPYSDLNRKVKLYLKDGVQMVWVIDPKYRTVDMYRGSQQTSLSETDTLSGEDVIPGFEVQVARLFEG